MVMGIVVMGRFLDLPPKPPTSITPFKNLQGLSYNEQLDLITGVHSSEHTWADVSHKAEGLKINKQILYSWLADLSTSSHLQTCRELIEMVGEEVPPYPTIQPLNLMKIKHFLSS